MDLVKKIKLCGVGLGVAGVLGIYSYFVPDEVQTKITDAQFTKVDGHYMVATEYRPFRNEDAWYRFKFNSGDMQNKIIGLKGHDVIITKYGWRNPLFSQYENIVDVKLVK